MRSIRRVPVIASTRPLRATPHLKRRRRAVLRDGGVRRAAHGGRGGGSGRDVLGGAESPRLADVRVGGFAVADESERLGATGEPLLVARHGRRDVRAALPRVREREHLRAPGEPRPRGDGRGRARGGRGDDARGGRGGRLEEVAVGSGRGSVVPGGDEAEATLVLIAGPAAPDWGVRTYPPRNSLAGSARDPHASVSGVAAGAPEAASGNPPPGRPGGARGGAAVHRRARRRVLGATKRRDGLSRELAR